MLPQRFTFDRREHVDERRRRLLGVPRTVRKLAVLVTNVREPDDDETVEHHSHRGGSLAGTARPVPRIFESEAAFCILKCDCSNGHASRAVIF